MTTPTPKLFLITAEGGDAWYVEATSYSAAVALWREEAESEDEPEVVHLVHSGPALRPSPPGGVEATLEHVRRAYEACERIARQYWPDLAKKIAADIASTRDRHLDLIRPENEV